MSAGADLGLFNNPRKTHKDRAMEALDKIGIAHLAHRLYTEISGGEQQMTLIARALAQDAKTIVMDEPTSALDYGNTVRVKAFGDPKDVVTAGLISDIYGVDVEINSLYDDRVRVCVPTHEIEGTPALTLRCSARLRLGAPAVFIGGLRAHWFERKECGW